MTRRLASLASTIALSALAGASLAAVYVLGRASERADERLRHLQVERRRVEGELAEQLADEEAAARRSATRREEMERVERDDAEIRRRRGG